MHIRTEANGDYVKFTTTNRLALFESSVNGRIRTWEKLLRPDVKLTASTDAYVSPYAYRV